MVAVVEDIKYESSEDLIGANETGGSRQEERIVQEEIEKQKQEAAIQAGLNDEAALDNIQAAQQAQQSKYIFDPITGEVIETQGSDGELSVASVIGLLERGASEEEIESALGEALTSIAGRIAKDKRKAKKHLAELMELMHVLETVLKQSGKNVELQNALRQMQEKVSKLMKDGNVKQIQEFLKNAQLREVLTKSTQLSRQQIEALRTVQELTRNLAQQAKEANLPRELALKQLQEVSRNILQSQLKEALNALREAYNELSKEYNKETDLAKKEAIKTAIKEIAKQAQELQQLQKETQGKEVTAKQFEQVQKVLKSQLERTTQLTKSLNLSDASRQALTKLASKQQTVAKALDARLSAHRAAEGNLVVAQKAALDRNLSRLQTQTSLLLRANDRALNLQQLRPEQRLTETSTARLQDRLQQVQKQLAQEANPSIKRGLESQIRNIQSQINQVRTQATRDTVVARQAEQRTQQTQTQKEATAKQVEQKAQQREVSAKQAEQAKTTQATQKAADAFAKDTSKLTDLTKQLESNNVSTRDLQQAQKSLQGIQAKTAELARDLILTPSQQKSLDGLDINQNKINALIEKGDLKGAQKEITSALKAQAKELTKLQETIKADAKRTKVDERTEKEIPDYLKNQQDKNAAKPGTTVKNACDGCPCGACPSEKGLEKVQQLQNQMTKEEAKREDSLVKKTYEKHKINPEELTGEKGAEALDRIADDLFSEPDITKSKIDETNKVSQENTALVGM